MSFSNDDQQLQRYLDGELSETDAAAFAARMLADNDLRQRVDAMKQVQLGFASVSEASAADPVAAPAGFTAGVLAEVRRLPSREQMQQTDLSEGAIRLCRRLLLAAAILLGMGLGWQSGLFSPNGSDRVEAASPAEIEAEMQRLDDLAFEAVDSDPAGKSDPRTKPMGAPRRGK
jgi:anti-sigma factor RsiW